MGFFSPLRHHWIEAVLVVVALVETAFILIILFSSTPRVQRLPQVSLISTAALMHGCSVESVAGCWGSF